jgi:hypothetical protein
MMEALSYGNVNKICDLWSYSFNVTECIKLFLYSTVQKYRLSLVMQNAIITFCHLQIADNSSRQPE